MMSFDSGNEKDQYNLGPRIDAAGIKELMRQVIFSWKSAEMDIDIPSMKYKMEFKLGEGRATELQLWLSMNYTMDWPQPTRHDEVLFHYSSEPKGIAVRVNTEADTIELAIPVSTWKYITGQGVVLYNGGE